MKRLLFFVLKVIALVALAIWLADQPGTAHIVWHDYVIETSAAFLGLSVFILGLAFYTLFRLWYFVRHGPQHWRLRRRLRKIMQGHNYLTEGLIAVAGGDATEAGRRAVQARRNLGVTAATQLLQAQAAQLAGDTRAAQEIFRALAAEPNSAVLGYRGLIMEARRAGNRAEVERLVEKLHRLKPETPWLNLVRFELLVRQQAWDEANIALAQVAAAGLLDRSHIKYNRAALWIAASQSAARQGYGDKAIQAAEKAARQAQDWLPALLNLADIQMKLGHRRAAHRTIEKNWKRLPHPQFAMIWREGENDPVEACRQIEKLSKENSDAPISHLAIAEAALAADIWGEARRHLMALISRGEATQSAYRLLAKLERREAGDEPAALRWLMKVADAPADPLWLCQTCGGTHEKWQALCAHCGSFCTLHWQSPGTSRDLTSGPPLDPIGIIGNFTATQEF